MQIAQAKEIPVLRKSKHVQKTEHIILRITGFGSKADITVAWLAKKVFGLMAIEHGRQVLHGS